MTFVFYLQIHFWLLYHLDILTAEWPDYGFVINKQMVFLQIFISQLLLFYFQNIEYNVKCDEF